MQGCLKNRLLGVLGVVGVVVLIASLAPSPKCGQVGYYPRLSAMCRAAQTSINVDVRPAQYCSADELRDIECAAATYERDARLRRDEWERALTERTY